mmetsp:Transcript_149312/g.479469  ORF Transcript_149312/g.479469 Transcript_149312/m.479469 type:complete len:346 (+) Transcript_149312:821-1858(+)
MSSKITEGAESLITPIISARVTSPLRSTSVKLKTFAASACVIPSHTAPFFSKASGLASHASSTCSNAAFKLPHFDASCFLASAITKQGDTAAKPAANSHSETRFVPSWGSRIKLKMALCSLSSMMCARRSASPNSGNVRGMLVVSWPPPSMTAMASIIPLKPRQTKRFRTAASVVTGVTASRPVWNSCKVNVPSRFASINSKMTRASNMLHKPHFAVISHHSRMSKDLFPSMLMASNAASADGYALNILRRNWCSGWPCNSCPPFAIAKFLSLFTVLERGELACSGSLSSSSVSTKLWMNLIRPPTSRSILFAEAPLMSRITFWMSGSSSGSHLGGLLISFCPPE